MLDSGAAVSIITEKLRQQLGLKVNRPSKIVVITANGTKQQALGEIQSVEIVIKTLLVPMKLQVIESTEQNFLLVLIFSKRPKPVGISEIVLLN